MTANATGSADCNVTRGKVRVMFVDDESQILDGIRRQFHSSRKEWDMRFASSGAEAIGLLEQEPADVVITDMRMPKMSGSELLLEVQRRWPEVTRIVLSGQTDVQDLQRGIGAIHQFFSKPCNPEEIRRVIKLVGESSAMLRTTSLRRVVSGLNSLPITQDSYAKLRELLQSEHATADDIASVVQCDVGISTKVLQLVNTAFFGTPRRIASVKEAVVLLGARTITAIVFTGGIFDAIKFGDGSEPVVSSLWAASSRVGIRAASVARSKGHAECVQEAAMLAGMLSLIGRAALACYLPAEFERAMVRASSVGVSLEQAEQAECGVPQQSVSGYCLRLWGFSSEIIEAVVYQASPRSGQPIEPHHPLLFLHVSRAIERSHYAPSIGSDNEFLSTFGVDLGAMQKGRAA